MVTTKKIHDCSSKGLTVSTVLTKKQQSMKDREAELLSLARNIIKKQGFTSFTMDCLAVMSPYSKGTIYNHFCSKEDVITALCIDGIKKEVKMLSRALDYKGTSREKMIALHVAYRAFIFLEPDLIDYVLLAKSPLIIEKASTERVNLLRFFEEKILSIANDVVNEALKHGDLRKTSEITAESIVLLNWSMSFGYNALTVNAEHIKYSSYQALLMSINMLLDGLNWLPLSTEHDYIKVWQQVERQLFDKEIQQLA